MIQSTIPTFPTLSTWNSAGHPHSLWNSVSHSHIPCGIHSAMLAFPMKSSQPHSQSLCIATAPATFLCNPVSHTHIPCLIQSATPTFPVEFSQPFPHSLRNPISLVHIPCGIQLAMTTFTVKDLDLFRNIPAGMTFSISIKIFHSLKIVIMDYLLYLDIEEMRPSTHLLIHSVKYG